jgi:hypothetical protein
MGKILQFKIPKVEKECLIIGIGNGVYGETLALENEFIMSHLGSRDGINIDNIIDEGCAQAPGTEPTYYDHMKVAEDNENYNYIKNLTDLEEYFK